MLQEYQRKRRFERTPEPPPSAAQEGDDHLTFVVQQHAARRLHWDLRLEWDGALKSWAVPNGPSLDPEEKRLAVAVEDHPLAYGSFEGVIPKGEYGAGEVIVWDRGIYTPDEGSVTSWGKRAEAEERMRWGYQAGKLSITLRGRKLKGSWTLVRTQRSGGKDWLLIKHRDPYASNRDVLAQDRSVISGLAIEDLRGGRLPPPGPPALLHPQAVKAPFPRGLRPMLAMTAASPFDGQGWLFEAKLDGIRVLAAVGGGQVELRSRNGNDITQAWPAIVASLASQFEAEMLLDGEIVALSEEGVPSFQALQPRIHLTRRGDILRAEAEILTCFYIFDILYLNGHDLRKVPLTARKLLLWQALDQDQRLRYVDYIEREGVATFQGARRLGFEGVVAKRADSRYEAGARSRHWLKVKAVQRQEFVVCGYTAGEGGRRGTFGALLLGYYDEEGRLVYAGNVGSGFKEGDLMALRKRLDRLRIEKPLLAHPPELKGVTWVQPQLVVEVKFSEWTKDGALRAPVYLGVRPDVDPGQVRREESAPLAAEVGGGAAPNGGDAGLAAVADLLGQLERAKEEFFVTVQGRRIKLTNLNKEFWPPHGDRPARSKRDLIRYYVRVAPWLLPHLRDRPLTLTRYADGISGAAFYQKQLQGKLPPFVQTVKVWSSEHRRDREYVVCNNLATLVWLAQLADLELHAWMARVDAAPDAPGLSPKTWGSEEEIEASVLNYPDFLVVDLDPYIYAGSEGVGEEPALNPRAFELAREFAFRVKDVLGQLQLVAFVKTTGKTGLHVYVPLIRRYNYDQIRGACEVIGRYLLQRYPGQLSLDWAVEKRAGKLFFDYNQNVRGKTLAAPYSLRPAPEATVSMPLTWRELATAYPTDFTMESVPALLQERGDAWAGILEAKRDLQALLTGTAG